MSGYTFYQAVLARLGIIQNEVNTKLSSTDLSTYATNSQLNTSLLTKANTADITTVMGLIPLAANNTPWSEKTGGAIGTESQFSRGDHQHPRLTSTTVGTISADSKATLTFTRTFTSIPGIVIFEHGGDATAAAMPTMFKVESWTMNAGLYTGCVVRAWRGQLLPSLGSVSGILTAVITGINSVVTALTTFNVFGSSASGVTFSCIVVARSDV